MPNSEIKDTLPCPVNGCRGHRKNHDMAMCRRCWYLVPAGLRTAIWRLYRSRPGGATHIAALHAAYQAAEQAIAKGQTDE